jgi:hypothetical protein
VHVSQTPGNPALQRIFAAVWGNGGQFINIEVFPVIAAADAYDQRQVFEASLSLEGN